MVKRIRNSTIRQKKFFAMKARYRFFAEKLWKTQKWTNLSHFTLLIPTVLTGQDIRMNIWTKILFGMPTRWISDGVYGFWGGDPGTSRPSAHGMTGRQLIRFREAIKSL